MADTRARTRSRICIQHIESMPAIACHTIGGRCACPTGHRAGRLKYGIVDRYGYDHMGAAHAHQVEVR